MLGVGAPGHQEDEVGVVVDPRALGEAFARLHGQRVKAEVDREQFGHGAVARGVVEVEPEEAGAGQRGQHVLLGGEHVAAVLAQRPVQHRPSFTAADRAGVDDGPRRRRPGRLSRSGTDRTRWQGRLGGGQLDAGHVVGETPSGIRALEQPVGAVARRHPRVGPSGQPAHQSPVVGRGRAQPDAGLEVGGALEARGDRQALTEQLVEPGRGHVDRVARAGLERAPAGDPPARPRDEVVGEQGLRDGPPSGVALDAQVDDLTLGRTDRQPAGEPLPRRRVHAPPGHGDGVTGQVPVSGHGERADLPVPR